MNKYVVLIVGGIGDILLSLDGLKKVVELFGEKNIQCLLFSHYNNPTILLKDFPRLSISSYHYDTNDQLKKLLATIHYEHPNYIGEAKDFSNNIYPDIGFKKEKVYPNKQIGIHPFGSSFSNEFLTGQRKVISKNLSIEFVHKLVDLLYDKYGCCCEIFVTKNEFGEWAKNYDLSKLKGTFFANYPNIWDTFYQVSQCDYIIAADSAIKSYSLIKKIPTTVLVGDYEDPIRDQTFLNPYLENGHLTIVKFTELNEEILYKVVDSVRFN
jgi:hypothetical protein